MFQIKYLPNAVKDLVAIRNWYSEIFGETVSMAVIRRISKSISRLEMFPNSGSLTPDPELNAKGFRMIICERHVAIYKLSGGCVYIHHIADTRTDYSKIFTY